MICFPTFTILFEGSASSRVRLFDVLPMICTVYIRYLRDKVITVWNNSVFAIPHAIVLHCTVLGKSASKDNTQVQRDNNINKLNNILRDHKKMSRKITFDFF